MTRSISTTAAASQRRSSVVIGGRMRRHIYALSDETLRQTLAYLDAHELRQALQVCVRWRTLSTHLIEERDARRRCPPFLPWNAVKQVFALLDPANLAVAARVCVFWETTALCFFSAQLGRRHVHEIPAEIIKKSFALLEFDELRSAAQVCVRWRDLGIEHPGFWQDIEIRSPTTGSIDMLSARIGQSNGRPCSITVDIEEMHPNIESRLLGLLTCITSTVRKFIIRLNAFYLLDIWGLLLLDYPELVVFELKLYSADRIMPLIAVDPMIFEGVPGKLKEVRLVDVLLPFEPVRAFSNLRVLNFIHPPKTIAPFPTYLLEWCQNLYELRVWSGFLTPGAKWSASALAGLSSVCILDVHLKAPSIAALISEMPQRDEIPLFSVTSPEDEDATYDFLLGLQSPFGFEILSLDDKIFALAVDSLSSGYRRAFAEYTCNYPMVPDGNPGINALFNNPLFPEQVQSFRISASLWISMASYISFYTAVVPKLVLRLNTSTEFELVALPRQRLAFPALQTLVLEAGNDRLFITPEEILTFVDDTICAPQCCNLELHHMVLQWPHSPVTRRFTSVTIYAFYGPQPVFRRKDTARKTTALI